MKRSGFKLKLPLRIGRSDRQAPAPMKGVRATYAGPAAPREPIAKGVVAKPGRGASTALESAWMDAIVEHGCVACLADGHEPRPTTVHHILRGGRRLGHLFTLPLCDPGHHQGGQELGLVSRHPWKTRFEEKYGEEMVLLHELRSTLKARGVDVPELPT